MLIAYISANMTLLPGDIISTGTPSGIGPLHAGDTVTKSPDYINDGRSVTPETRVRY